MSCSLTTRIRAAKLRRQGAFRPQVETLENRLAPGDTLFSGLLGTSLLGAGLFLNHNSERPAGIAAEPRDTQDPDAVAIVLTPLPAADPPTDVSSDAGASDGVGPSPTESLAVSLAAGTPRSPGLRIAPADAGHSAVVSLSGVGQTARFTVPLVSSAPGLSRLAPAALVPAALRQAADSPSPARPAASGAADLGQVPLTFEANQGQADPGVRFLARGPGYTLLLTPTESVLALPPDPATGQGELVHLGLAGANPSAPVLGLDPQAGRVNYFRGSDPARWQTDVPTFGRVEYQGVYAGIDLVYYGSQRQLEYDFRVAPGADPGAIRLHVTGGQAPAVDAVGNLVLHTAGGDLVQHRPLLFQEVGGVRREVAGGFVVQGREVRFTVGAYDRREPLVIDPVVGYSTYLGGSGADEGHGIKVDAAGNVYVAGKTTSANFPTLNPFQTTYQGGLSDAFVTKLNPAGTGLVYSTYLGGAGDDEANCLAVDAAGNAYVTGSTSSANFPTTAGAYQQTFGGGDEDAFVTKLSPTGSALVYSTYFGGIFDDSASSIAIDSAGNAYVTGSTNTENFPTTPGAFQRTFLGFNDSFVTKFNPAGTALVYSTYLAGEINPNDTGGNTYGGGIVVDAAGNAYVTGQTDSLSFPVTAGAFQTTFAGGETNAYVTKLNPTGATLVYSSFLGGDGNDNGSTIAIDSAGDAYVTGTTDSATFPTVNAFQRTNGGGDSDAFLTKVNPGGSALVYSTYLGGSGTDEANEVVVDAAGTAYVAGDTTSANFPTVNPTQAALGGLTDGFVTKFNPAGTPVFSTFLGGSGDDAVDAVAVDASQSIYVTGSTTSANFPTTPGVYQGSLRGTSNAFITKFADQGVPQVTHFRVTPSASSVVAGSPFSLTVTALDASENPVPGYRGTVTFGSSDPQAALPGPYPFTAGDSGTHQFDGVALGTAGSQTVTVTDPALPASGSTTVTVTPAPAVALAITVPAAVVSGTPFDGTVTAVDSFGNTDVNFGGTVTWATDDPDPGVMLPPDHPFQPTDQGSVTFPGGFTLVTPGTTNLFATDLVSGITGTVAVTVNAGGSPIGSGGRTPSRSGARPLSRLAPPGLTAARVGLLPVARKAPARDAGVLDEYFRLAEDRGSPEPLIG